MKINKTTLKNGLRLITVPMTDNPSVTVLVMVEAGSNYESKEIGGLSHFLEHMVFKGTPKRPKAIDISRELDSLGAQYNAFTGNEYTGYYAKVDSRHLDRALDIVSDMYLNPLFESAEAEKEKGVIIEELRMYKDLPQQHVHEVLSTLMYGDQPAGRPIIGTEDNIKSFTREQLLEYRAAHYVSSATTVIVAGSFDETKINSQIENVFASIPLGTGKDKVVVKESQDIPKCAAYFKEVDQTHIAIGLRTFSITDPRIPVMSVLSTLLGGGMSSRLFSKMRDELGICYYIRASHSPYTDHGDLTISAGVDNARVEIAVKGILEECQKLKDTLVGDDELKKVKDCIAGTTMLGLETSEARAEFCGYQEILKNKIEMPEDMIERIQKVSPEDIQKLACEIFSNKGLNMSVVGKYKDNVAFLPYLKFD